MENDIATKVQKIQNQIRQLLDDKYWREDLQVSIEVTDFTADQARYIDEAIPISLKTLFKDISEDVKTPMILTHTFTEAPAQLSGTFMNPQHWDKPTTIQVLRDMEEIIGNILHNYPLILKENMPGSINNILKAYEKTILPEINKLLIEITNDPDYNTQPHTVSDGYVLLERLENG